MAKDQDAFDKFVEKVKNYRLIRGELKHINLTELELNDADCKKFMNALNSNPSVRDYLQELDLSYNNITIPPFIKNMKRLVALDLSFNKLESLPEWPDSLGVSGKFKFNNNPPLIKFTKQNDNQIFEQDYKHSKLTFIVKYSSILGFKEPKPAPRPKWKLIPPTTDDVEIKPELSEQKLAPPPRRRVPPLQRSVQLPEEIKKEPISTAVTEEANLPKIKIKAPPPRPAQRELPVKAIKEPISTVVTKASNLPLNKVPPPRPAQRELPVKTTKEAISSAVTKASNLTLRRLPPPPRPRQTAAEIKKEPEPKSAVTFSRSSIDLKVEKLTNEVTELKSLVNKKEAAALEFKQDLHDANQQTMQNLFSHMGISGLNESALQAIYAKIESAWQVNADNIDAAMDLSRKAMLELKMFKGDVKANISNIEARLDDNEKELFSAIQMIHKLGESFAMINAKVLKLSEEETIREALEEQEKYAALAFFDGFIAGLTRISLCETLKTSNEFKFNLGAAGFVGDIVAMMIGAISLPGTAIFSGFVKNAVDTIATKNKIDAAKYFVNTTGTIKETSELARRLAIIFLQYNGNRLNKANVDKITEYCVNSVHKYIMQQYKPKVKVSICVEDIADNLLHGFGLDHADHETRSAIIIFDQQDKLIRINQKKPNVPFNWLYDVLDAHAKSLSSSTADVAPAHSMKLRIR